MPEAPSGAAAPAEDDGWPRGEAQLEAGDAVRWMVPDAAPAQCTDEAMATAVQEFCQEVAWTRNSRKE